MRDADVIPCEAFGDLKEVFWSWRLAQVLLCTVNKAPSLPRFRSDKTQYRWRPGACSTLVAGLQYWFLGREPYLKIYLDRRKHQKVQEGGRAVCVWRLTAENMVLQRSTRMNSPNNRG